MSRPRILVFAGSIRTGSLNETLAAFVVRQLRGLDADVSHISLKDYPMPLYDGDLEKAEGQPDAAKKLHALFADHEGIFIAGPEYNAGLTPLAKNTIDWVSRVDISVYRTRAFALGAASEGRLGGYRSLMATRQVLELGCGAFVQPEIISVFNASKAWTESGELADASAQRSARRAVEALVAHARRYAA